MKTITISTAEARNNLSKILAEAYYSDTVFLVTKNEKVVAEIRKPSNIEDRIKNFANFIGTLSNKDAKLIKESISANDKSSARTTPIKPLK